MPLRISVPKIGTLFLVLLSILGCDQLQDAPKSQPTPVKASQPVTINPDLIGLFDGRMRRSSAFKMSGDLRPIWIVSGRLRNNSDKEIKSVTLKIDIITKSTALVDDESILKLDIDVLPSGAVSFSRDIQLTPSDTPWEWTADVIKADPK